MKGKHCTYLCTAWLKVWGQNYFIQTCVSVLTYPHRFVRESFFLHWKKNHFSTGLYFLSVHRRRASGKNIFVIFSSAGFLGRNSAETLPRWKSRIRRYNAIFGLGAVCKLNAAVAALIVITLDKDEGRASWTDSNALASSLFYKSLGVSSDKY